MTVRDDYPAVAVLVDAARGMNQRPETVRMFEEIERLRSSQPRPLSVPLVDAMFTAYTERRAGFPFEDERMSFAVVVLNFGWHLDAVACTAGEWTGTKGDATRTAAGLPCCPNGHPLLGAPTTHRLALIEGLNS